MLPVSTTPDVSTKTPLSVQSFWSHYCVCVYGISISQLPARAGNSEAESPRIDEKLSGHRLVW